MKSKNMILPRHLMLERYTLPLGSEIFFDWLEKSIITSFLYVGLKFLFNTEKCLLWWHFFV